MNEPELKIPKQPYQTPLLEQHLEWNAATAGIVSGPIGIGQE